MSNKTVPMEYKGNIEIIEETGGESPTLRHTFNNNMPINEKCKVSPEEWAKAHKQMVEKEKSFVMDEISFEIFCIIYKAFDEYTGTGYCAQYERTVELFNKKGLYHPFNKGELKGFEKRDLEVDENEISSFIEKRGKYTSQEIEGRFVWGIGRAAIVLCDEILYNEEEYPHRSCKGKTFHNFNPKKTLKNKKSFGNGIEIMKKLKKLYGE